jgi:hypothetical protein
MKKKNLQTLKTMKLIDKLPTPADQIERETAKLFTPTPLKKLAPFILLGFWIAILFAIFSS